MAQIYKPPTKEQIFSNTNDNELKRTLTKMFEIHDILLVNQPNDKYFNNRYINYFLEFSTIMFHIESNNARYTDKYITNAINNLHKKIFKNRRY